MHAATCSCSVMSQSELWAGCSSTSQYEFDSDRPYFFHSSTTSFFFPREQCTQPPQPPTPQKKPRERERDLQPSKKWKQTRTKLHRKSQTFHSCPPPRTHTHKNFPKNTQPFLLSLPLFLALQKEYRWLRLFL